LEKRAGTNMRCTGKNYRNKDLWFNEECIEKKREVKEALRKFKEEDDDDESRIQYWESREAYERTVDNKMCLWQEKVAEYINKLITQKAVKKVWEATRNITRRKERTLNFCGTSSHKWVSCFQELFSISSDRMLEEIMTSHNTNCRSP
jgi:hypothetical protein